MEISYQIIRSDRKTISIQIQPDGTVVVRCPRRMKAADIRTFVTSKSEWITKHLSQRRTAPASILSEQEIEILREKTRQLVVDRAAYYAPIIRVRYNRIAIRTQHTRWGSCSSKGNLNFNCLLALVPDDVLDYVVVHELCHLKQMNHSDAFWAEVRKTLPDYRKSKEWLKVNGRYLISKLPK